MEERFLLFPDSGTENFDMNMQTFIWISRYSSSIVNNKVYGNRDIREIGVLNDEIDTLYNLVDRYIKEDTKLLVCESHKNIVSVIDKSKKLNEKINVYNIDFHDDCFCTNETEIHCGNWGRMLLKKKMIDNLSWIKRDDSECNGSDIIENIYNSVQELYDNPKTLNDRIDYIFICRSGMWSPPHLDDKFVSMVYGIADLMDITEPDGVGEIIHRWNKNIQDQIYKLADQIQKNIKENRGK